MRKKFKLSSDGGDSGSKKSRRGYGGVWRSLSLAGDCSLCWCVLLESGFSRREDVLKLNSLYKDIL
jgi:hypothetical protein